MLGIIGVARNVAKRMPTTAKPSSVKLEKKEEARSFYLGVHASPNCNDDYNNDNNHNNYNNRKSKSCGGDIIPNIFSLVELDLDYVSDEDSP